jgi:hypothetical protein
MRFELDFCFSFNEIIHVQVLLTTVSAVGEIIACNLSVNFTSSSKLVASESTRQ